MLSPQGTFSNTECRTAQEVRNLARGDEHILLCLSPLIRQCNARCVCAARFRRPPQHGRQLRTSRNNFHKVPVRHWTDRNDHQCIASASCRSDHRGAVRHCTSVVTRRPSSSLGTLPLLDSPRFNPARKVKMWDNVLHRVHPSSSASETQLLNKCRPSGASVGPRSTIAPRSTSFIFKSRKSSVAAVKQSIRAKKGWEAFKELCLFYVTMLQPCVVVTVWMFGFFAAISYLVPNVLCRKSIASTPVSIMEEHHPERFGVAHQTA